MKTYTDKVKRGLVLIEAETKVSWALKMAAGEPEEADSLDAAWLWIKEHAVRLDNHKKDSLFANSESAICIQHT